MSFCILYAWYYVENPLGFSGGAYALVAPYYVSEVAEVSLRGALASVQQLMATLGVLFVNALNINGAVDWSTISGKKTEIHNVWKSLKNVSFYNICERSEQRPFS